MPDTQRFSDRCGQVAGLQLANTLTCVDMERLPTLAVSVPHSKTPSSNVVLSSSKVKC